MCVFFDNFPTKCRAASRLVSRRSTYCGTQFDKRGFKGRRSLLSDSCTYVCSVNWIMRHVWWSFIDHFDSDSVCPPQSAVRLGIWMARRKMVDACPSSTRTEFGWDLETIVNMLHRVSVLCLLGKQRDITSYQQQQQRAVSTQQREPGENRPKYHGADDTWLISHFALLRAYEKVV